MNWKHYLGITIINLLVLLLLASFQAAPGYMDAEYYYGMGLRIANGEGFSEPYLWNYLKAVDSIPHPGFSYWMPLPAIMTAAGIWITGLNSFLGGKTIHILLAALIPALTMKVARKLTQNNSAAILAGLLAVFPVFYNVFLITTDSFGITILLGGVFYLLIDRKGNAGKFIGLGLVAGLMHLSRADGMLWVLAGVFCALLSNEKRVSAILSVIGGYLIIMTPWYIRNLIVLDHLLPAGISRTFWLGEYNDLFTYTTSNLTYQTWFSQGLNTILRNYLTASVANLKTAVFVQGQIILTPLIGIGAWRYRRDRGLQISFLVWAAIFLLMSVVFPFAGMRGGYLHSSAAFQALLWGLAAGGFYEVIQWGIRKRDWVKTKAELVFGGLLVVMVAVAASFVFSNRVIGGNQLEPAWNQSYLEAKRINSCLDDMEIGQTDLVMINNPPGFYVASGRSSIVIPNQSEEDLLAAGQKYGAAYLIIERNHPSALDAIYENPEIDQRFTYLGSCADAVIFQLPE